MRIVPISSAAIITVRSQMIFRSKRLSIESSPSAATAIISITITTGIAIATALVPPTIRTAASALAPVLSALFLPRYQLFFIV